MDSYSPQHPLFPLPLERAWLPVPLESVPLRLLAHLNDALPLRLAARRAGEPDAFSAAAAVVSAHAKRVDACAAMRAHCEGAVPAVAAAYAREAHGNAAGFLTKQWDDHTRLRDVVTPDSRSALKMLLRTSWIALARATLVAAQARDVTDEDEWDEWPRALMTRALDYDYVQSVAARRFLPVASGRIGTYAPAEVMLAMNALCDALDAHGWTPSAGQYMEALFLRYALYLHAGVATDGVGVLPMADGEYLLGPDDASDDEGAQEEEAGDADPGEDPMDVDDGLEAMAPPAPAVRVEGAEEETEEEETASLLLPSDAAHPGWRLSAGYLDVGERLFFHHVGRQRALERHVVLAPRPTSAPSRALAAWQAEHGRPLLERVLRSILRHDALRDPVNEAIRARLLERFLWPGEREQLAWVLPEETETEAANVLFRLRLDVYKKLQPLLSHASMPDLVRDYMAAATAAGVPHEKPRDTEAMDVDRDEQDADEREQAWARLLEHAAAHRQSVAERVVQLVTEVALGTALRAHFPGNADVFAAHLYSDNRAPASPADRPPANPGRALGALRHDGWPVLVVLWGVHCIVESGVEPREATVTLATPDWTTAVAAWLWRALQRGHMPRSAVHNTVWLALAESYGRTFT